jgi:hypothetical protein
MEGGRILTEDEYEEFIRLRDLMLANGGGVGAAQQQRVRTICK